ncbi:MAG: hypothetical protein ACRCV6_11025 [Formosimonas sp.]
MDDVVQVPNELSALLDFAMQSLAAHRFVHAQQACEAALRLDAQNVDVLHCLSHVYACLGHVDWAQITMSRARQLAPTHAQINYNSAVNAHEMGDSQRAILYYQQALRSAPDMPDVLWNYGELLRLDEHFVLALDCFERLVALGHTHYVGLWHRMAVCYSSLKQYDKAQLMYDRLMNEEHDVLSHWEYALFLLSQNNYAKGTQLYNDRFLCDGRNSVYQHDFPFPLWSGQFTKGSTLLLHGEQGLGDELMFASMFNELLNDAERAGAQVVLACKPPLVRLFAESFPRAKVLAHKVGAEPANLTGLQIDAQMAMGHLMSLYRRDVADFAPHRVAYLKSDAVRAQYYEQRLQQMTRPVQAGRRMRVGLMWGSNPAAVSAKFMKWTSQRSVALPLLAAWADMLDDVEFVSLQNHERGAEAALVPQLQILDFSLEQVDFYDTAALASCLDLVISVDTSVSHLAGGMALDTWVPLMSRPDWRHGTERDTSIWYAGTRYFRQRQAGVWTDVVAQMHQALRERASQWRAQHAA